MHCCALLPTICARFSTSCGFFWAAWMRAWVQTLHDFGKVNALGLLLGVLKPLLKVRQFALN